MKQVPNEAGRELAKDENYLFSGECSAKNNTNIKDSINKFIEVIFNRQVMYEVDGKFEFVKPRSSLHSLKQAPEERIRKQQKSDCIIF